MAYLYIRNVYTQDSLFMIINSSLTAKPFAPMDKNKKLIKHMLIYIKIRYFRFTSQIGLNIFYPPKDTHFYFLLSLVTRVVVFRLDGGKPIRWNMCDDILKRWLDFVTSLINNWVWYTLFTYFEHAKTFKYSKSY